MSLRRRGEERRGEGIVVFITSVASGTEYVALRVCVDARDLSHVSVFCAHK